PLIFTAASLWPARPVNGNLMNYVGPGIAVDWLEIEGPLQDQWPAAGHRRLFGDLPLVALPPAPKVKLVDKKKGNEPVRDVHLPFRPPENALTHQLHTHGKAYITNLSSLPKSIQFST